VIFLAVFMTSCLAENPTDVQDTSCAELTKCQQLCPEPCKEQTTPDTQNLTCIKECLRKHPCATKLWLPRRPLCPRRRTIIIAKPIRRRIRRPICLGKTIFLREPTRKGHSRAGDAAPLAGDAAPSAEN